MMSSEWRKVGLHLKIKAYILDNISKNQRDKVEDCCLQMCREWLEKKKGTGEVERKWRSLLDCVEKVYGPESRRDIEKELKEMVCVCVRVRIHACMCVHACMHVCVCVHYMCLHAIVHGYTLYMCVIYKFTHVCMCIHLCSNMYVVCVHFTNRGTIFSRS